MRNEVEGFLGYATQLLEGGCEPNSCPHHRVFESVDVFELNTHLFISQILRFDLIGMKAFVLNKLSYSLV